MPITSQFPGSARASFWNQPRDTEKETRKMCAQAHSYIQLHIHTYTYFYIHIHTYTRIYLHVLFFILRRFTAHFAIIHTYTYIYIHIHMYTDVYIHIIVYIYSYTCNIHPYTYIYWHGLGGNSLMTGCLPIFLQMKGGGGPSHCQWHPSPSAAWELQARRLRVRVAGSWPTWLGGGSGMDQPEFWTQLKREKSSQLDRVESSKLTRYHQGGSAWGRSDSTWSSLRVDSWAAARQSGPGWNADCQQWTRARHSVRPQLARVWIWRT